MIRLSSMLMICVAVLFTGPVSADVPKALARADVYNPPRTVPAVTVVDGQRREIALESFKGKPVMITFWATWCGPCVREMPSIDRLQAKLGVDKLMVVPISLDRKGPAAVDPLFERKKIKHLTAVYDPSGEAKQVFGMRATPTTVILNAKGEMVMHFVGETEWDSPPIVAYFERLAAEGTKQQSAALK